jgi:hypothetical protein
MMDEWMSTEQWRTHVGKVMYSEKTCHSAPLSTTNPTQASLGLNLGLHGGKMVTNHQSHGMANSLKYGALRQVVIGAENQSA